MSVAVFFVRVGVVLVDAFLRFEIVWGRMALFFFGFCVVFFAGGVVGLVCVAGTLESCWGGYVGGGFRFGCVLGVVRTCILVVCVWAVAVAWGCWYCCLVPLFGLGRCALLLWVVVGVVAEVLVVFAGGVFVSFGWWAGVRRGFVGFGGGIGRWLGCVFLSSGVGGQWVCRFSSFGGFCCTCGFCSVCVVYLLGVVSCVCSLWCGCGGGCMSFFPLFLSWCLLAVVVFVFFGGSAVREVLGAEVGFGCFWCWWFRVSFWRCVCFSFVVFFVFCVYGSFLVLGLFRLCGAGVLGVFRFVQGLTPLAVVLF